MTSFVKPITSFEPKLNILVLDTAPLLQGLSVFSTRLALRYVTVPEVIAEVRSKSARESVASLPFDIETLSADAESLRRVTELARTSGDFSVLSLTDIKVLALTHMLTQEHKKNNSNNGVDEDKDEAIENNDDKREKCKNNDSEKMEKHEHLDDGKNKGVDHSVNEISDNLSSFSFTGLPGFYEPQGANSKKAELQKECLDDEGWITTENIIIAKSSSHGDQISIPAESCDLNEIPIACMTTDFAMQNVLLRMNLRLLALDGRVVTCLKNWLLRCNACFRTTMDMDRKFCSICGSAALRRVSYKIENGEMKLYLKKNYQHNLRGTIFSIPEPKSGKNAKNLILVEDQKEFIIQQKMYEHLRKKQEKQLASSDVIFGNAPLVAPVIRYGRANPNVAHKTTGRRSKKTRN